MPTKIGRISAKQITNFNNFIENLYNSLSTKSLSELTDQEWNKVKASYLSLSIPLRQRLVEHCENFIANTNSSEVANFKLYASNKLMMLLGMCTSFAFHVAALDYPKTIKATAVTLATGACVGFGTGRFLMFCHQKKVKSNEEQKQILIKLLEKIGVRAEPVVEDHGVVVRSFKTC